MSRQETSYSWSDWFRDTLRWLYLRFIESDLFQGCVATYKNPFRWHSDASTLLGMATALTVFIVISFGYHEFYKVVLCSVALYLYFLVDCMRWNQVLVKWVTARVLLEKAEQSPIPSIVEWQKFVSIIQQLEKIEKGASKRIEHCIDRNEFYKECWQVIDSAAIQRRLRKSDGNKKQKKQSKKEKNVERMAPMEYAHIMLLSEFLITSLTSDGDSHRLFKELGIGYIIPTRQSHPYANYHTKMALIRSGNDFVPSSTEEPCVLFEWNKMHWEQAVKPLMLKVQTHEQRVEAMQKTLAPIVIDLTQLFHDGETPGAFSVLRDIYECSVLYNCRVRLPIATETETTKNI